MTMMYETVVSIGKKITLKDLQTQDIVEYQLVGSAEAVSRHSIFSNESPVAKLF